MIRHFVIVPNLQYFHNYISVSEFCKTKWKKKLNVWNSWNFRSSEVSSRVNIYCGKKVETDGWKGIHIERQACYEAAPGGNKKGRKKIQRLSERQKILLFSRETDGHHTWVSIFASWHWSLALATVGNIRIENGLLINFLLSPRNGQNW